MERFSISFTLGNASEQHGANIEHNNRKFSAANVDESLSFKNMVYTQQGVRDAYNQLFGQALAEYNAKQKQPCRRIQNYYDHICKGNREEPFYEVVVQFGDMQTAPCGSERGKIVTEMLDEYMKAFQQRNPNLHVFNAVLHLDEASPHLHIDFIPFYSQQRMNGLSKGVSMRAALDEMGFQAKGQRMKYYFDMREKLEVLFDGKRSDVFSPEQAKSVLKDFPSITESNWRNVYQLIEDQGEVLQKANDESEKAQHDLREAAELVAAMERITNGSYVQSLVADENDRRNSDFIPNGTIYGSGAIV